MQPVRRPASRGFTMIEIMIVIGIIAILAAIIVPNYLHVKERQKLDSCEHNISMLQVALESYAAEHSFHPAADTIYVPTVLVVYGYIESIPVCPVAGTQYGYTVVNGANLDPAQDQYTLYCKGTSHAGTGISDLNATDVPGYSTQATPKFYPGDAWPQKQ